jgi:hypothetical protein
MMKRMKKVQPDVLKILAKAMKMSAPSTFNGTWDENLKVGTPVEPRGALKAVGCGRMKAGIGVVAVLTWAEGINCSLASISY